MTKELNLGTQKHGKRQVSFMVPEDMAQDVAAYARKHDLGMSEAYRQLLSIALGKVTS